MAVDDGAARGDETAGAKDMGVVAGLDKEEAAAAASCCARLASWIRFKASASLACFCHLVEVEFRGPLAMGAGEPTEARARTGPWRPSGESRAKGLTSPVPSVGEASAESGASQKLDDARACLGRDDGVELAVEEGDSSCHEKSPAAFAVA